MRKRPTHQNDGYITSKYIGRILRKLPKSKIMNHAKKLNFNIHVELVNNADIILEKLDRVVSSDSVIIDKCISYFNLNKSIINQYIKSAELIDLSET